MLTLFGNEITDGRFAWVTPEKDIELLKYAIKLGYKATLEMNPMQACWQVRREKFLRKD